MIARLGAGRAGWASDRACTGASPVPGTRSLRASRRYRTASPQVPDLSRSAVFSGSEPAKAFPSAFQVAWIPEPGPRLDERSVGWLRYLHRKATTPDSWDRDGRAARALGRHQRPADALLAPLRPDRLDVRGRAHGRHHARVARGLRPHPRRADLPPHRLVGGARLADADRPRSRPRELPRHLPAAHPRAPLGQLRRAGLDRERHRAVGPADGPDRRDRQPVLQGLLPGDARPAPAHDRRRALERAVRHRARRREHVHVVPLGDRRAPARAVDARRPTAATARTRRSGRTASRAPASACSSHDLLRGTDHHSAFDGWWNDVCRDQVPAPRRRRAAARR